MQGLINVAEEAGVFQAGDARRKRTGSRFAAWGQQSE